MKTRVSENSIEAYYSLDHSGVLGKVAKDIILLTARGDIAYIGKVAKRLNMEQSTVSPRFGELREKPFLFEGVWYRMVFKGKIRVKNGVRFVTVDTWQALPCQKPAEQTALPL